MTKTAAYLTLCTLILLCLCTCSIEVNFKLASKEEALTCTIPKGLFKLIDDYNWYYEPCKKKRRTSARLDTKEECEIPLSQICTHKQYEHFKAFWETDLAALPEEEDNALLQYQTDLTAGLFDSFLFTADYLNIQGEYAKRFAKNMVRYGLLGKHSKDITENSRCKERDLAYDTFETMLPVFFKETRLRSRTITHFLSAKKKTLLIESINEKFKKFDDEYTGPSQTTRMRIVLYSRLGPAMSQEKERNEAVLVWLLLNMGGSSMDIQYSSYIASDNFYELRQSIGQFTKENEKGACVYVEG
ncbi:hypothetical protein NECID01_1096, partial [Nematocida sp. AWRm77]